MKYELQPCYILHYRPYRENSIILDVFSRDNGRVSIIAKGIKGKKRGQYSLLQPGNRLNIAWSMRGELGTLIAVEQGGLPFEIHGRTLVAVFYLNELLIHLLHKYECHRELFDAYNNALLGFNNNEPEQPVLRVFEKKLLDTLGYGLVLDHDVHTGKDVDINNHYNYIPDLGPTLLLQPASTCLKVSGLTLKALDQEQFPDEGTLMEAKLLMRFIINNLLGNKPLASRDLYQAFLNN